MQVILIEDVPNLGNIGDQVNVKGGYARNFLFPQKLAIEASTKNKRERAHQQRVIEFKAKKARAADEATLGKLGDLSVTIARKVGDQDKLYGSVTSLDIEAALREEGIELDRRKILLDEPIKTLGVYEVQIRLRKDLTGMIKVWVVGE